MDSHVGRHIFEKCIISYLKGKTRILVTHQLQYLRYADHIVYIDNGVIIEQGTYQELINKKDGALQKLLSEYTTQEETREKTEKEENLKRKQLCLDEEKLKKAKLVKEEERAKGAISFKVIRDYTQYGIKIFVYI